METIQIGAIHDGRTALGQELFRPVTGGIAFSPKERLKSAGYPNQSERQVSQNGNNFPAATQMILSQYLWLSGVFLIPYEHYV